MALDKKVAEQSVPQRVDIEERYKWNLKDIFESEEEWEEVYQEVKSLIEKANDYSGNLNSPNTLFECLETRSRIQMLCHSLFQYAKLNQELDNRVSKFQALTERAAALASQADAAYSFIEPELLELDDKRLNELASQFPQTDMYDFFIKELIRSRKHIRSKEVEELLAQLSIVSRGSFNSFTMLDDADIKYPTIKDPDGNDVKLTKQRYSKILESSNQDYRKRAHEAFYSVYKDHVNTTGALLATSINKDIFYSKARKYESSLHQALDAHNIPVEVYYSLIEYTESDLSALHKWTALRKRILKLDKIYPYDMMCPLFPDQNYEVEYDDAIVEIVEAVQALGTTYARILKEGFEKRWIDVYETEGKGSGAFSWGNYSVHPYVLMNYNDTIDNMFTLAHEMGHALHSRFSDEKQPFPKAHYATFVAEVASTLNEGLLLIHLLKKATDKGQKLFLLDRHISNTFGTFFHQVLYANFEHQIHKLVEDGGALSPDQMSEIWEGLTKRYYGPDITMDEYSKYKWSRIPHFYMTYYVYQYATSYAASQAILDKFVKGEKEIVDKYLNLISSGGSDYPINLLRECGVDMTSPEPFKATLKLFSEQVDEVDQLTL
ncbi:MAG: oligoendopeptidase F [candidate division Zixibacteria bacterium]|nr:oligoendopeptidase F [candidate division Zixibacteria bacterium]